MHTYVADSNSTLEYTAYPEESTPPASDSAALSQPARLSTPSPPLSAPHTPALAASPAPGPGDRGCKVRRAPIPVCQPRPRHTMWRSPAPLVRSRRAPGPPAGLNMSSHPLPAPHKLRRAPPLPPAPRGGGDAMPWDAEVQKIPGSDGNSDGGPLPCRALPPRSPLARRPTPHHTIYAPLCPAYARARPALTASPGGRANAICRGTPKSRL